MSQLTDNLNLIVSIKSDIKSAIEAKGVSMTGVSFGSFADKIGEITTSFVTVPLSVSANGTYVPGQGVDGFSQVVVDVPQSVEGYTEKQVTEGDFGIVNLNNSASSVKFYAFYYDSYLQTVDLPNCISIHDAAFNGCSQLSSVSIPNCNTIGQYVFRECNALTSINMENCISIGQYALYNCNKLSELSLPNCISIGQYVFGNCSSLTQVELPNCESIGNYGFGYCSSLTMASFPAISYFGNNCFQGCRSLQELTLGTETYKIPTYQNRLFSDTSSFMSNGTIYVASDMYSRWIVSSGWSSLSSLFVSVNQSGPVLSYDNGVVYGITKNIDSTYSSFLGISKPDIVKLSLQNLVRFGGNPNNYFNSCTNLTTVSLPSCVELDNTFNNCTSLSEVYLPVCTKISGNAFRGCSSLTEISLPACANISGYVFVECSSLSEVYLPVCTSVGNDVFGNCISLSEISLPSCVSLGKAFWGCSSLTRIDLPVCKYLTNSAVFENLPITSINLPLCESITSWAFNNCRSLSDVSLPACNSIYNVAFQQCQSLRELNLPVCCYIDSSAFWGCYLDKLTLGSTSVCVLNSRDAFQYTKINAGTGSIYVPSSLVDAYKSATIWSTYSSQIFPIPE